ncbi:MAG: glycoside hydrolase family 2 TIM barrel-domain containing protein [Candidatus Methylacidiphilales bacterium]
MPTSWTGKSMEMGFALEPEVSSVPAQVPGSVQRALRNAGLLPDWFEGLNSRACEWVENRDWMFSAAIPDSHFADMAPGARYELDFAGLDGNGTVVFNKKQIGNFDNAYIPYRFDVTELVQKLGNHLHIIFFVPPRWLGQVGYTSQMKDWKPRFNYGWDWIQRVVQVGPWQPVSLIITQTVAISELRCRTDLDLTEGTGRVWLKGTYSGLADRGSVRVKIASAQSSQNLLIEKEISGEEFTRGLQLPHLAVQPWWPNGEGAQPLYRLSLELLGEQGEILDARERVIGFKHIEWRACENAPEAADPWICVVNGRPVFLQGVNWTPLSPTFADLREVDYEKMVGTYHTMGANIFRVWGGAYLEKPWFYELCDKLGILVWQEFPLSSSGHENWPHEDEPSMDVLTKVAHSYIVRCQHYVSLLMWCGGNELQGDMNGGKTGTGKPVTLDHPLMQRWNALVSEEDPGRRFVPSSSSGPRFLANSREYGQGVHWDVHGPWRAPGDTPEECEAYWKNDDSLFRSETGAPGTSSAAIIRRYSGGMPATPGTLENPLWRRFSWWLEWADFIKEKGREPAGLDEYVDWSQARQARLLTLAVGMCKKRFPGIGGCILWMGHDAFPCVVNTAIIDVYGELKPAGHAVAAVWKSSREALISP